MKKASMKSLRLVLVLIDHNLGLNEFSNEPSPMIEIKVVHAKTEKNSLSFEVKEGDQSEWKSLKINFISTTRSDIEIGTTSLNNENPSPRSF